MSLPALVLDAAARQALVAVRVLGRSGVAVGAADVAPGAPAFASRWCAASRVLPDFAADPGAYADAVVALCREWGCETVIPCHDGGIAALREHRDRFEGVAALALAPEPALAVAVDKRLTLEVAERLGIDVPRGAIAGDRAGIEAALDELALPVVVKPSQSWVGEEEHRRLGATLARTRDEALAAAADIADAGTEVAIQAFLPGDREAISFVYGRGRFWARFAQRADRMLPAIGGSSVLREAIALPADATTAAERLVQELDLDGYCEVEFRRDAAGRPVLMEINPRLSASVEVATRAGVPFPRLIHDLARGAPMAPVDGYRVGTRMRWLAGDVLWLGEALLDRREHPDVPSRGRAVAAFLRDSARRSGYDYVDRQDLRPAVVAAARGARRAPARVGRRLRRLAT